jgi:hypothetical protein
VKKEGRLTWWYILVIPAPQRLRQDHCELEASLDYLARPYLKNKTEQKTHKHKNNAGKGEVSSRQRKPYKGKT